MKSKQKWLYIVLNVLLIIQILLTSLYNFRWLKNLIVNSLKTNVPHLDNTDTQKH